MSIRGIESAAPLGTAEELRPAEPTLGPTLGSTEGVSFESVLTDAVGQANALDHAASLKAQALAAGAIDDLHGTMISLKEADISIKLVGTVRNKILDAFQELWRTSV
jgi:flagellar hook-basal body complex protein FliE